MSALPAEFRRQIVRPTLKYLDPLIPYSLAAENLLVGTALHESLRFEHIVQMGGGPALGFYQIEPRTIRDCFLHFLNFRPILSELVTDLAAKEPGLEEQLVSNLRFATAIARVVYWRAREALPEADDLEGLARYHKRWFNTAAGKADPAAWLEHYRSAVA